MMELPVGFGKEHTDIGLADEVFVCCPADAFVVLFLVWALQRRLRLRPQETQIWGQHVDENLQKMDHDKLRCLLLYFKFSSNLKPFNGPLLKAFINFPIITKCLMMAVR